MIVTDITKFDAYRFGLLVGKIKNVKADFDEILSDTSQYLKGYRYNDDNRIARIVVGNIFAEAGFNEEKAAAKFIALNSIEIMPYIKVAVLDAASADYHYTYEKQW